MEFFEKRIDSNTVYEGLIVNVRRDVAEIQNGKHVPREVVEHPGGVAIVPVTDDGKVLMVRQYRYPMERELLEIPAGKLAPGEDPLDCAVRELKEETGCTAGKIVFLGEMYPSPGYCQETLYLYLALELQHGEMDLDEDELLSLEPYPIDDLVAKIKANELPDAKTIIGIMKAKTHLGLNKGERKMGKVVLVVDDERNIVDILSFNLKKEGYEIIEAYDGHSALDKYVKNQPDLILLDVMLPLMNGFEVCRRIREGDNTTPIIMLTAREEETDKVFGLELGADDYITKPFSVRELQARVKANIRRGGVGAQERGGTLPDGLVIDKERFDVYVNGRGAELTQREFELISFLASAPGKVFSREELLHEVWQYEYFGDLRAVDVAVRRLREKVEEDSGQPKYIMTKRGVGYYFSL